MMIFIKNPGKIVGILMFSSGSYYLLDLLREQPPHYCGVQSMSMTEKSYFLRYICAVPKEALK